MTAEELWKEFSEKAGLTACEYDAWAFGGFGDEDSDLLGHLASIGQKRATASAFPCYAAENEPLPKAGCFSVVLDSKGSALCVIRTTRVAVVPFRDVTPEHAYKEGENGRTLEEWREVHQTVFSDELQRIGQKFTEDMPVVCEEFEVVHKK